jgi:DNA polymerase III subunit alpha
LQCTEEVEENIPYLSREELDYAYQNILTIKNSCEDFTLFRELKIPTLIWKDPQPISEETFDFYKSKIPYLDIFLNSDFEGDNRMAKLIINKFESDDRLRNQRHYDEINGNLESVWISSEVNKTHWSAYFLNLQKTIEVCWNAGTLVGPGRGSGVGFLLLYFLDIIQINCLWEKTVCFPWRFLNPDRVSVLDIDTDIEGSRRGQVLQALRDFYGQDRVANVVTFSTEKSKSALQTAARGLGIDNDEALYLASLIPADRGQVRTLKECFYGDDEKGFKPIPEFVRAMTNDYPELWQVAQKIEGLVCRVGEHAGGVIFVDEPFTKSTALMKVPNGDTVTQFDLHDSEKGSLIKIDLLSVECLDKIHNCLDLLADNGYVNKQLTLREKYEQLIGIYNLERENQDMWKMIWDHKILSLFQMEQQSGIQGIDMIKPKSVDELAVLNSVIRLMAPDKDSERPLETWVKNRKDINNWIKEMKSYGLSDEEIEWLSQHSAITDGICESQEGLMSLVQEPQLGGNSLGFADRCRKGIAKKQGKLFQECEDEFYKNIEEKHLSQKLAHYVWDVLLRVQRGYSFNRSHCLAYSLIALQEMNLCFKYPLIYWNAACLITDSGSEDAGTDYDKIAIAINKMRKVGIDIELPNVNSSKYGFYPDEAKNVIYCGFKSLTNVGEEVVENIISNRPYESVSEFYQKVHPGKQAMISLIKGGTFDSLINRKLCMGWYIWETCDKKKRLTLQNMSGLIKYGLLPERNENEITARRVFEFNRYLKAICKIKTDVTYYHLDDRAMDFLSELGYDSLIQTDGNNYLLNMKSWDKEYQVWMDIFRNWIAENKEEILQTLNDKIFKEDWDKYAAGNLSSWEMDALCFYYHDHELANVDNIKYGFSDFFSLPEEPIVERAFYKGKKEIKLFKLTKICGTCIAKNKNKGMVSLLTTTGVVNVKMSKEFFSMFDKQISERGADGVKHVIEKSFFNRGSMIVVMGMRSGDNFIVKKYASSGGHRLYKIDQINENGTLVLRSERYKGEAEDEV